MGLDVVELVMDVEEVFDVEIPDDQAARLVTIGDLLAFLRARISPGGVGACATHMVFNKLRRALAPRWVVRSACRPDLSLASIMPLPEWRQQWPKIEQSLALRMPDLKLPRWYSYAATSAVLASGAASLWAFGPGVGIALALAGGIAANVAGRSTLAVPEQATLGALSRSVVERNYGLLVKRGARWRDPDALAILRGIASQQYGVPVDRISAESPLDAELWPKQP